MAWGSSKFFRPALADIVDNTTAMDLGSDTIKVPLFDNTITPNQDVTAANSAYGAGVWASGGVSDTNWPAVGINLGTHTIDSSVAATVFMDAVDLTHSGTVTLVNVYGALVYDDTLTTPVADQGICFNYFGGAQTVTLGTFTIIWHANGLWRATL